jgi:hypothetical protein
MEVQHIISQARLRAPAETFEGCVGQAVAAATAATVTTTSSVVSSAIAVVTAQKLAVLASLGIAGLLTPVAVPLVLKIAIFGAISGATWYATTALLRQAGRAIDYPMVRWLGTFSPAFLRRTRGKA